MKAAVIFLSAVIVIYSGLNYRWLRAATVASISASCDAELLSRSKDNIAALYQPINSNPIIRCTDGSTLGLSVSHGTTNFAPALPSVILIGPEGENADVIAHEWAHAELFDRLGFVRREFGLPTWLDEGIAMQVDHRTSYNAESLNILHHRSDLVAPDFDSMSSSDFFVAGDQGRYHYAYAKCLVRQWISQNENWLSQLESMEDKITVSLIGGSEFCDQL